MFEALIKRIKNVIQSIREARLAKTIAKKQKMSDAYKAQGERYSNAALPTDPKKIKDFANNRKGLFRESRGLGSRNCKITS